MKYNGPIVTIVMDGIGYVEREDGNAVSSAYTPTLDKLNKD
jgi:2,3-bisphosphoglycerate-independent phosphoglycerate mutase